MSSPSPPSDGGEGTGEEARFCLESGVIISESPLSSILSPFVPHGERKKTSSFETVPARRPYLMPEPPSRHSSREAALAHNPYSTSFALVHHQIVATSFAPDFKQNDLVFHVRGELHRIIRTVTGLRLNLLDHVAGAQSLFISGGIRSTCVTTAPFTLSGNFNWALRRGVKVPDADAVEHVARIVLAVIGPSRGVSEPGSSPTLRSSVFSWPSR